MTLLREVLRLSLPHCLAQRGPQQAVLATLETLEISIVADTAIAKVHAEFFHDPTPTDVITFPHGEILLGAGTIHRQAAEFEQSPDREASLCLIHGLLHLQGYDDLSPHHRAVMHRRQAKILDRVFPLAQTKKNTGPLPA